MFSRVCKVLSILLLASVCATLATAQATTPDAGKANPRGFDATAFGEWVTLGPEWLFSPGDNPAWAAASFDDSGWRTVDTGKQLTGYGYRDLRYAWYRIHIHLRPGTHDLMLGTLDMNAHYEIYANGVRLAGSDTMRRQWVFAQYEMRAYAVPDSLISPQGDLLLAIRFAVSSAGDSKTASRQPLYPDSVFLLSRDVAPVAASYVAAHNAGAALLACGLALIVCVISFALFFALQSQREYLAIAICLLADSASAACYAWLHLASYTYSVHLALYIAVGVEIFALIEFVRLVLHLPRRRWLLALEVVTFLAFVFDSTEVLGILSANFYMVGFFVPVLAVKVLLPVLLARGWRRGNREALLLFPAIVMGSMADYWNFLRDLAYYSGFNDLAYKMPFSISLGSYQIDFYRLGDFAFYIAVLLFLILRTVRIAHDHARAAAELEAARTTQQLLLARCSRPTPGFHVEAIYHPASEVGGDFFEVSSMPDGGLIAIIGDVSGKGLTAAMRVAMILGVLRREDSWSPAQVLHNLNEALLNQGEAGFTTACCVHIQRDGRYTLANAGHIAPYVDGQEAVTPPPSLPLGLVSDQHYATVSGFLAVDQKLVLLSDGVVEARSASGELFGFDRLATLTLKTARAIADTAKDFGQEDDITVLTLARTV